MDTYGFIQLVIFRWQPKISFELAIKNVLFDYLMIANLISKISNKQTSTEIFMIVFDRFLRYKNDFQYECIHFIYHFYSNHRVCYWFYLLQFKLFFCKFDTPPSIRHVIRAFKFDKVVPPFALNYIWIGWHIYSLFTQ